MKIAHEYCDYLIRRLVAIGDEAVNKLDLSAQVEHFWSSGPCDPIESCGMGDRYYVEDINEPPSWLIDGLMVYYRDSEYTREDCTQAAVRIMLRESYHPYASALRDLYYKKGRFADSLKGFFATRGFLSPKQQLAINKSFTRR